MSDPEDSPPEHLKDVPGMDLVRRALEEARAAARGQGKDIGHGRRQECLSSRVSRNGGGPEAVGLCLPQSVSG